MGVSPALLPLAKCGGSGNCSRSGLQVRDHRLFGGVVELADVPLWGRLFFRMIGGKAGDRRDWAAVEAWASGIAESLTESGHLPSTGTR